MAGTIDAARIEAKIAAARGEKLKADLELRAALDCAAWRIAAGETDAPRPIVENFEMNGFLVRVEPSIEGEKLDLNVSVR